MQYFVKNSKCYQSKVQEINMLSVRKICLIRKKKKMNKKSETEETGE